MNQAKTFIVVVAAMLCIAGACTYFFQEVLDEQPAFVAAGIYAVPAQQAAAPKLSTMHTVAHTFSAPQVYKPSSVVTSAARETGAGVTPLPTYAGSKMQSYGASVYAPMPSTIVAPAVPMATQTAPIPSVHVSPLAYRTTAVQSTHMAPRRNRMLTAGRAEVLGNYVGTTTDGNAAGGSYAPSGPVKAPGSITNTWQGWLDEYYGTGYAEGDISGLQAWWDDTYGNSGIYPQSAWDDFYKHVLSTLAPIEDGWLLLLVFASIYVLIRKRKILTIK